MMPGMRTGLAVGIGFAVLAIVPARAATTWRQQGLDTSERALIQRAREYVVDYEQHFAFLIAEETYKQSQAFGEGIRGEERVMKSELFLTFLAGAAEWIAVRDVIEVDGYQVADRDSLRQLLTRGDVERSVIGELVDRNARFNIGGILRNFNEPTLPLLLFDARRADRVKFNRKSIAREGDTTLATLTFEERDRPTLVQRRFGGPLPAKGEIVIDAATGAIRRTTFELDRSDLKVSLSTVYARDEKIGLWLPSLFRERYESAGELITCEARYTNYRRFETAGRIKR